MENAVKYRPDIDGLRALAVIPVIFFHAGFTVLKGGFVGVDIFFVISGYLITAILLKDLQEGKFSLVNFYERRARRILPALFFVVFLSVVIAWLVLSPQDMKRFSESVAATAIFSSNIFFWKTSGYFDAAAALKPMLHTWSLAVEEQFYIGFPLLLLLLWKFCKRRMIIPIAGFFILSLCFSHWGILNNPFSTFYLLPGRMWELLLGALIAVYHKKPAADYQVTILKQFLSFLGIGFIAFSFFVYDKKILYPSFYTLLPTLGAGLIILFSGPRTHAYRFLSNRILVQIGLMSYSLYLWHQPLFAFARHYSFSMPSGEIMLMICAVLFPLSYVSWKFVEQPFRRKNFIGRKKIFFLSSLFIMGMLGFGAIGHVTNGFEFRFNDRLKRIYESQNDQSVYKEFIGNGDKTSIAIIGDSHAHVVLKELEARFTKLGLRAQVLSKAGCPPITHVYSYNMGDLKNECDGFNVQAYKAIISDKNIRYVLVFARYPLYLESTRFDNQEGGKEMGGSEKVIFDSVDYSNVVRSDEERIDFLKTQFAEDISGLVRADKKVILVYPIPEMGWDVPKYLALKILRQNYDGDVQISYKVFKDRAQLSYDMLDKIALMPGVYKVLPEKVFCDGAHCAGSIDQKPLYFDNNHLNNHGASMLVDEIIGALDKI